MTKSKHTTFRFDDEIKEAFKKEIEMAGLEMTEVLESFMVNFVNIRRNERRKKVEDSRKS